MATNKDLKIKNGIQLAGQITSSLATGTAPLVISSTTAVINLNADLLDGMHADTANTINTIVSRDATGGFSAGTILANLVGIAGVNDGADALQVYGTSFLGDNTVVDGTFHSFMDITTDGAVVFGSANTSLLWEGALFDAISVGLGANTLAAQSTASSGQVAVGYHALQSITTNSQRNTAVGFNTLSQLGANSAQNIAIGSNAGSALLSGSNNVILGGNTGSTITGTSGNVIISDGAGNIRLSFDSAGNATFSGTVSASGFVGGGTVTSVSMTSASGVTASITNSTTAPVITLTFATQAYGDNATNVATTAFVDRLRSSPTSTSTTAVIADRGKTITTAAGVTIPANVFAAGDCFSVYNNSAATITLTSGAGLTLHLVGTATTGNRTLAQRGIATVYYISATEAVITGGGLA